jgi:CheY-like chemotaxis protein
MSALRSFRPRSLMGGHDLASASSGGDLYAGPGQGATALVVEDDEASRLALTALLERGRLTVLAAENGQMALDTLGERDDVGIVLMDIMMPVMDGYEAMAKIRARPENADLPVIVVTAQDSEGVRERCLAAGASDYIVKPIEAAELLTAVGKLLVQAGNDLSDGATEFSDG